MFNKKGDLALPLYLSIGMAALVIILVIFGIFFFVVGIKQNPKLIISSADYGDSSKLLIILKTETNNLTIGELISLAEKDESYKTQLNSEISKLVSKLTKPTSKGVRTSSWIFKIYIEDQTSLEIGTENLIGTNYLNQVIYLPLENKKLAKAELYLDCLGCSKEDIDAIA